MDKQLEPKSYYYTRKLSCYNSLVWTILMVEFIYLFIDVINCVLDN